MPLSVSKANSVSLIWCAQARFRPKVDGFEPHIQRVNFGIVGQVRHSWGGYALGRGAGFGNGGGGGVVLTEEL